MEGEDKGGTTQLQSVFLFKQTPVTSNQDILVSQNKMIKFFRPTINRLGISINKFMKYNALMKGDGMEVTILSL